MWNPVCHRAPAAPFKLLVPWAFGTPGPSPTRLLLAVLLLAGCPSSSEEPALEAPTVTLWPDCRFGDLARCDRELEPGTTFGSKWSDGLLWSYRVFLRVEPVPSSTGTPIDAFGVTTSPCLSDDEWDTAVVEVVDGVVDTTGVAIPLPAEAGLDCPSLEEPYPLQVFATVTFDEGAEVTREWTLSFEYCDQESTSEACGAE